MRTSTIRLFLSLSVALTAAPVMAQAPSNKQAPPNLEKLEEGNAPDITIRPKEGGKTKQKREQGVVTEVEVQSGKSNYRVKQSAGPGNAAPGDAQSNAIRPPQWTVKEFDWGRKKEAKPGVQASDAPAPPESPQPPAKK